MFNVRIPNRKNSAHISHKRSSRDYSKPLIRYSITLLGVVQDDVVYYWMSVAKTFNDSNFFLPTLQVHGSIRSSAIDDAALLSKRSYNITIREIMTRVNVEEFTVYTILKEKKHRYYVHIIALNP